MIDGKTLCEWFKQAYLSQFPNEPEYRGSEPEQWESVQAMKAWNALAERLAQPADLDELKLSAPDNRRPVLVVPYGMMRDQACETHHRTCALRNGGKECTC
jgi:hypothetical protein